MLSLHAIDMDLRKEARKVLSVFASEAKMKKIELALDFGDTLLRAKVNEVKTDPVRLGQVSWWRSTELTLGRHESNRKRCAVLPFRADSSYSIYRFERCSTYHSTIRYLLLSASRRYLRAP